MKSIVFSCVCASLLAISSLASAEDHHAGIDFSVGTPYGVAVGFEASPTYWLRGGMSFTNDYFAPGVKCSLTLDPIRFPVGLTFTADAGHVWESDLSSVAKKQLPTFDYSYLSLMPGVEFGTPAKLRFYLRAGATWVNVDTHEFSRVLDTSNVSVSDPRLHGIIPAAQLGFTWLFI